MHPSLDHPLKRKSKIGALPIEVQIPRKELSATLDQALLSLKRPEEKARKKIELAEKAVTKCKDLQLKWDFQLKM